MPDRAIQMSTFLAACGLGSAEVVQIVGDASARRYFRARDQGRTFVVMDVDPVCDHKTSEFIEIAMALRENGLSAPEVYESDLTSGFLLLEDLI